MRPVRERFERLYVGLRRGDPRAWGFMRHVLERVRAGDPKAKGVMEIMRGLHRRYKQAPRVGEWPAFDLNALMQGAQGLAGQFGQWAPSLPFPQIPRPSPSGPTITLTPEVVAALMTLADFVMRSLPKVPAPPPMMARRV